MCVAWRESSVCVCVRVWGGENQLVSAKCWIPSRVERARGHQTQQPETGGCVHLCVSCSFDPWPHFQHTSLSSLHIHQLASCVLTPSTESCISVFWDECEGWVAALIRQLEIFSQFCPCVCRTTRSSFLCYFGLIQCSISWSMYVTFHWIS